MPHVPLLALSLLQAPGAADWPHWRGPHATGATEIAAPRSWSDAEHVRWHVPLPGRGMSSPIVLGERVFVSTAVPVEDSAAEPATEERGRGFGAIGPQSFELHCLSRTDGTLRWRAVARVATPHEGYHKSYSSWASASPITDGERVYVSFGSQGVFAWDLDGTLLWSFDPGVALAMRNGFGEGLAPVLAGDVLVQVADQEKDSFAFGLDVRTGKELWRVTRDEPSTWATPLVTEFDGRLEVVTSGTRRLRAYAPGTGALLWDSPGLGVNAIPAVVRFEDTVLAMSGYRDARIVALPLADPGEGAEARTARWTSTKGCAYTASPVLCDGLYYTVTDSGQLSCFDAATGEAHYLEERLPRGSTLKASPVAAGELLYLPTEAGDVHVVRLGPTFELVGTNTLAEQSFVASPAVAHGALFLRSLTELVCVGDG